MLGFFDIASKQIQISRDVQWSGKFHANGEYVSIPNYNQNTTIQITGDTGHVVGMTQGTEYDPDELENQNMNKVRMTCDPMHDNVSEIVLVGGTDESYDSPETVEKEWNHENGYLRSKWREAIKKDFDNMVAFSGLTPGESVKSKIATYIGMFACYVIRYKKESYKRRHMEIHILQRLGECVTGVVTYASMFIDKIAWRLQ